MGWLRKRFGESSTMAGLSMLSIMVLPMLPPHWQLIGQGIAGLLGAGAVVTPEAGNR